MHGTKDTNGDDVSTGYGGTAGDYFEVAFNAIRGDQGYYCFVACLKTRPALMLRGKPTSGMHFDANVLVHGDLDSAVSLTMAKGDTGWGEDHDAFNFEAAGNTFGTDHSSELATGDFDGDHKTDVFVATGTAWFYSRGGQGSWEFLHASDKLTRELGFADVDNDGTTDVLYRDAAGNLGFLESGRVPLQPLTTTPEPMENLRFGDFDGDGTTDIFYTRNGQWNVWYGSVKAWRPTQTSSFPISAFLFGEFDAQKGTDVAAVTDDKWQISSGSTGSWTELNSLRRSTFGGAVVADFDGDGRTDI
ncbi:MAG TPA: VCBS repeat-containing protein, partial [Labilithrix sp.]|nr:VCBS repeat-containing protein [Labilithrix sp.]